MIPVLIQMNKHDHRKPYPGDHGIRFEPIDDPRLAEAPAPAEPGKSKGRRRAAR